MRVLCMFAVLTVGCGRTTRANNEGLGVQSTFSVGLTDAQIAGVSLALNRAEVAVGQVALPYAVTSQALGFAGMMVSEHSVAILEQSALLQRLAITPEPTSASQRLDRDAQGTAGRLAAVGASGPVVELSESASLCGDEASSNNADDSFDCIYVVSQVRMHREALTLLDEELLPQVTNEELSQFLMRVRVAVQLHLLLAARFAGVDISNGPGGTTGGGDPTLPPLNNPGL